MPNISTTIGEFLGTFVLLYVILQSSDWCKTTPGLQPFIIVSGLLVAILMFGALTGGHFNPAVSTMLYLKGDSNVADTTSLLYYVVAQVLGGAAAYYVKSNLLKM